MPPVRCGWEQEDKGEGEGERVSACVTTSGAVWRHAVPMGHCFPNNLLRIKVFNAQGLQCRRLLCAMRVSATSWSQHQELWTEPSQAAAAGGSGNAGAARSLTCTTDQDRRTSRWAKSGAQAHLEIADQGRRRHEEEAYDGPQPQQRLPTKEAAMQVDTRVIFVTDAQGQQAMQHEEAEVGEADAGRDLLGPALLLVAATSVL